MMHKNEYYIVDREALPEVYSQVVEAKRLLASGKADTVQEAVDMVGISRSSFYKYKDMIEPFTDMVRRKTVTIAAKLEDMPGVLPKFLLVLDLLLVFLKHLYLYQQPNLQLFPILLLLQIILQ